MSKPLTEEQEKEIYDLYYNQKFMFGRDKVYKKLQSLNSSITRRQVQAWLDKQEINQLYRNKDKPKIIKSTILDAPYKQIGVDLVDMQNNEYKGYKYILTAIDLFSKYAWTRPLKSKEAPEVAKAMNDILKEINVNVSSIRSDRGSEFISDEFIKVLKKNKVKQVLSLAGKPQSNGQIENFNGQLKRALGKVMTTLNSKDWVKFLEPITENYNKSYHRITGTTPEDAIEEDSNEIKEKIKKNVLSKRDNQEPKFKIGDKVRLKLEGDTGKGKPNFSKKIYTIYNVNIPKNKVSAPFYEIEDDERKYTAQYYDNDFILANEVENPVEEDEKFIVSKILDKKTINKKIYYLVKWQNYSDKYNTWEPRDELLLDVPKIVNAYEKELKNNNK